MEKALNQNWDRIDNGIGQDRERIELLEASNTIYNFKGIVQTLTELQGKTKTQGDVWYCIGNSTYYACNGSEWIPVNLNLNLDVIEELEQKTIQVLQEVETPTPTSGTIIDITDSAEAEITKIKINGNSEQNTIKEVEGTTVTGESITVDDVELENGRITVNGNSKQETRSGKNKFIPLPVGNNAGITVTRNVDGTYNITGTATANIEHTAYINLDLSGIENGSSYILSSTKSLPEGVSSRVEMYSDTAWVRSFIQNITSAKSTSTGTADTTDITRIRFGIFFTSGTTVNIQNIGFQLEEGTVSTEYEQYGVSPSSDYPSEVESCGDNVNYFKPLESTTKNGITITKHEDGSFDIKGTSTEQTEIDIYEDLSNMNFKFDRNYTLSLSESINVTIQIAFYKDNTWVATPFVKGGASNEVILTSNIPTLDANKIRFLFTFMGERTFDFSNIKIKLEEGTKATSYSPYGQGCINEVICNKNFLKFKTINSNNNGLDYNFDNNTAKFNGTTTATVLLYNVIEDVLLKKGTYTFSFKSQNAPVINSAQFILRNSSDKEVMSLNAWDTERKVTKTFTEDTMLSSKHSYFYSNGKITYNNTQYILQIEKGSEVTEKVEHQSQTYTIPTQQPMRAIGDVRDIFVKINNKWYERHYINRYYFTGQETIVVNGSYPNTYNITLPNANILGDNLCYCNIATGVVYNPQLLNEKDNIIMTGNADNPNRIIHKSTNFTDITEYKAYLSAQYNAGTSVYFDYILATPIDIECTEEQVEVLNQLYNTTIYTPTTHIYSTDEIAPNTTLRYNYVIASPSVEIPSEVGCCGDNVNLFNGEVETGNINTATGENSTGDAWRSKNYINVNDKSVSMSMKDFVFSGTVGRLYFYKNDNTYISNVLINALPFTATLPSEATKVRFFILNSVADINSKVKVENGIATGYSEYGQGCINEVVCNKNLLPNNATDLTKNGITFTVNKDKSITVNGTATAQTDLVLFGKYNSTSEKFLVKETITFGLISTNNNVGLILVKDGTTQLGYANSSSKLVLTEDTYVNYVVLRVLQGATISNQTFYPMIVKGTNLGGYVEHQSQTFTIPTQQPMRSVGDVKDTFVKINNKWYERHYINRKVFNGTEGWGIHGTISSWFFIDNITPIPYYRNIYDNYALCNVAKQIAYVNAPNINDNEFALGLSGEVLRLVFKNTNYTTLDAWKTYLQAQYNAGTPVYVDYVLATPIDIECTEEQTEILFNIEENAKTYNKITHIYSTDEVGPNIEIKYKKDIATLFKNTLIESGV